MRPLADKLTLVWFTLFSLLYLLLVLIPKRILLLDSSLFVFLVLIGSFFVLNRTLSKVGSPQKIKPILFFLLFLLFEGLLPLSRGAIGGMVAAAVILLSSLGWGRFILKRAGFPLNSALEEFLFSCALGLAVNSALVLFLLRFFSASGGTIAVYALLTLLLFFSEWTRFCKRALQTRLEGDSPLDRLLLFTLMTALSAGAFAALSPPVMDDELMYHLSVPERWLGMSGEAGRVLPDVLWSGYPMGMEALYTLALALNNPLSARLLSFLLMILSTGAVAVSVRSLGGRRGEALIAALLLGGSLTALIYSSAAYSTSGLVFMTLMAGLALIKREESGGDKKLLFSALAFVMAAGASCVKYTAWIFLPAFFALFLYDLSQFKKISSKKIPILFVFLGILILSPHVYKNLLETGNPVFPYASSLFGGEGVNNWVVQNELANLGAASEEVPLFKEPSLSNVVHHLLLPIRLTMADLTNRYQGQGTALGAGWLILLPLLLLRRPWRIPNGRFFALFCGGWILLFVVLLPHYGRFALPALALTAVCYGANLSQLKNEKLTRLIAVVILFFALFPGILRTQTILQGLRPVITGEETHDAYLTRRLGDSYRVWRWTAENTPENAAVLSIRDYRRYYAERRWYCDYTSSVGSLLYSDSAPEEIVKDLFEQKIYYLFLNNEAVDLSALPSPLLKPSALAHHTLPLYETPTAGLYRIVP